MDPVLNLWLPCILRIVIIVQYRAYAGIVSHCMADKDRGQLLAACSARNAFCKCNINRYNEVKQVVALCLSARGSRVLDRKCTLSYSLTFFGTHRFITKSSLI